MGLFSLRRLQACPIQAGAPFERKVMLSEDIMGTTSKTGVGIAYWIKVLYLC